VDQSRPASIRLDFVSAWHDHPVLLEAFAERVVAALAGGSVDRIIFTAHSLPVRIIQEGDPYADQVRATAAGVAARAGLAGSDVAYQSAGRTPEPWLGPSLEQALGAFPAGTRVLVAPIGFVCDHTEILFDIDVQAQAFAREHSLEVRRTESLNTSPTFIRALADVVRTARG
jgi:ferrochelatase